MNIDQYTKHTIIKLILKSIAEDLDAKETEVLNTWLVVDDNRKLYDNILSLDKINAKQKFYNAVDSDMAYQRVVSIISKKPKPSIKRFYKYSAILVLALIVGFLMVTNYNTSAQITEANLVEISPGYHRATLVLANGKEVDLKSNENETIFSSPKTEIKNSNSTLEYKNAEDGGGSEVQFNTLHIPTGGIYAVVLSDGSKVWLNSNSTLKYPEIFTGNTRDVELEGEAYFEVTKNKRQFIVHTKNQDITVLGTAFNVSAYNSDNFFSSTLVEGKVSLSSDAIDEVILAPGNRGYLKFDSGPKVFVSQVDVRNYSAWKDGEFFFDNENLEVILKKIGRWYGFQVYFKEEELKQTLFTGIAKKQTPIKNLLEMIAKTSNIKYQVNKKKGIYEIIISK